MIQELEGKVSALKLATQTIHDEVRADNTMLGRMGDDFSRADTLMGATLSRLDTLLRYTGGNSNTCLLMLFVVFVLVVLWYLTRRAT